MVLPGNGEIAWAVDETTKPAGPGIRAGENMAIQAVRIEQYDILKAFTRELAFIRTFSVDSPSQYDQADMGVEASAYRSIINSQATPPRVNPSLEEAVKQAEMRRKK